ncbi:hypothetical protein BC939DRAFT_468360 [Gamsiella multidivaricata]|uniref:uncharacterized protein n=1 Tax=Gamsiella multidivaricata TaxID=101098 RepID=UPI00221F0121|nr:uncharacterized protein BC939DRAFT_468360 [Gamsiella multidivaricata]KAI7816619.1 hypothetical protein BC939DRAFT_468360 [Gamsiella multidivaricata]
MLTWPPSLPQKRQTMNICMTLVLGLCLTLSMFPTNCAATVESCLENSGSFEDFKRMIMLRKKKLQGCMEMCASRCCADQGCLDD